MQNYLINIIPKIEYLPAFSTFIYLYVFYIKKQVAFSEILLFVFASSFLHHIFPDNGFIRFFDWTVALILVALVVSKFGLLNQTDFFIITVAILMWVASFILFHYFHAISYYQITHTAWHLLSAYLIFIIFK